METSRTPKKFPVLKKEPVPTLPKPNLPPPVKLLPNPIPAPTPAKAMGFPPREAVHVTKQLQLMPIPTSYRSPQSTSIVPPAPRYPLQLPPLTPPILRPPIPSLNLQSTFSPIPNPVRLPTLIPPVRPTPITTNPPPPNIVPSPLPLTSPTSAPPYRLAVELREPPSRWGKPLALSVPISPKPTDRLIATEAKERRREGGTTVSANPETQQPPRPLRRPVLTIDKLR